MDSAALTKRPIVSLALPMVAVFWRDLRQTVHHWAFLSWAAVGLVVAALGYAGARPAPKPMTPVESNVPSPEWTASRATQSTSYRPTPAQMSGEAPLTAAPTARTFASGYPPTARGHVPAAQPYQPAYAQAQPPPYSAPAYAPQHVVTQPPVTMAVAEPAPRRPPADEQKPTSTTIATAANYAGKLFGYHLMALIAFPIILGASAIAGEADIAPEAILARGIARWQYYLSKLAARSVAVSLMFLALTLAPIALVDFHLVNDVSSEGLIAGARYGVAFIVAVTALSVAGSVGFRNPMLAVAALGMCVYGAGIVVAALDIPNLSPVVAMATLPEVFRGQLTALQSHQLLSLVSGAAVIATLVGATYHSRMDL